MPPHMTFHNITIHTAKCDLCNLRNKDTLMRCTDCGWSICTPCWIRRGDNGMHAINVGAGDWGVNRGEAALGRIEPSINRESGIGGINGGRTEHGDAGSAEGSEEGEIREGESNDSSRMEIENRGKGKERATEATGSVDIEMEDVENDEFERAIQESKRMATSTRNLGRLGMLQGEGPSSSNYNENGLSKSSDLTSNLRSSLVPRAPQEPLRKHRKVTREGAQMSSSAVGIIEESEGGARSQASSFPARRPSNTTTVRSTHPKPTTTPTARPAPKIQIRVPRARKLPLNPHISTNSTNTTTLQPSNTSHFPSTATTTTSSHPQTTSYTNTSIDLLLQAASVIESHRSSPLPLTQASSTQLANQTSEHLPDAQPVPSLLLPESFHSSPSPLRTHSPPELVEQTFYTRADLSTITPDTTNPETEGRADNTSEARDETRRRVGGGSNGVAPRLRRLYWDAAIVRDGKGRVRKSGRD